MGRALGAALVLAGCVNGPAGGSATGAGLETDEQLARAARSSTTDETVFAPRGITTDRFAVVRQPVYDYVTADDGRRLAVAIFRPDTSRDRGWKTPVILINTPYDNELFRSNVPGAVLAHPGAENDVVLQWRNVIEHFTPKGYTVVIATVRGLGRSEGCHDILGPRTARDYVNLVEYFARRPWSNGRVGGYGISYDGMTQLAGAVHAPRGLVTIVPVAASVGVYETGRFDGVPNTIRPVAWGEFLATALVPELAAPAPVERTSAQRECEPDAMHGMTEGSGNMTRWLAEREFRARVGSLRASVLFVQGLNDDFVVRPINLHDFYDRIPTFHRAIIGQWAHVFPDEAGRNDWRNVVHAWLDYWLLGLDTGVTNWPAVQVQDDHGGWRAVDSYAAMSAGAQDMALGDGALGGVAAPAGSTRRLLEAEQLEWTSAPLATPLHLSGVASLDLVLSLDSEDARFYVELWEDPPEGSGRDPRQLTFGYLSARHRRGVTDPEPVTPGVELDYRARTLPFDHTVGAGSRLRLVLTGVHWTMDSSGNGYAADIASDGRSVLRLPVANPGRPLQIGP